MFAPFQYQELIERALQEDLGTGDLSSAIFPRTSKTYAKIYAKQTGIVCGLEITKQVFKAVDPQLEVSIIKTDGEKVERGTVVMEIAGAVGSILSAERTALNFCSNFPEWLLRLMRQFV